MKPSLIFEGVVLLSMFAGLAAEEHAVFKSSDQGRSWIRANAGMPPHSRINAFGTSGGVVLAGTDSGIFASSDEALTWRPVASVPTRILCLATLGDRAFAGTDGQGMIESLDHGQTWVPDAAFPARKVRCLLVHKGSLYAGTDADGVFAANANASGAERSWTRLAPGLPEDAQVFALSAVEGRLFAALYGKGLHTWNAQGPRWTPLNSVTPLTLVTVDRTLIAGHNPGGIHWSGDLGVSWAKGTVVPDTTGPLTAQLPGTELFAEAPVWEMASNQDVVFAGVATGIYYSRDAGRTWSRARTGLPSVSPGMAFLVQDRFVLAGTRIE